MTDENSPWKALALGALLACGVMAAAMVLVTSPPPSSVVWPDEEKTLAAAEARGLELGLGTAAPEFVLADTEGDSVRLSGLRGGDVALVFVSAGCGYCDRLAARLAGHDRGERDGLLLIFSGPSSQARQLREDNKLTAVPVLVDSARSVSKAYQVRTLPTVYVLDGTGAVTAARRGLRGGVQPARALLGRADVSPGRQTGSGRRQPAAIHLMQAVWERCRTSSTALGERNREQAMSDIGGIRLRSETGGAYEPAPCRSLLRLRAGTRQAVCMVTLVG